MKKQREKFIIQYTNKEKDKRVQLEFITGERPPILPFIFDDTEFTTLYRYKSTYLDGMPYSSTDWIYPD